MTIATPPQTTLFGGNDDRVARTISSALWAAWADAVGFISELVDERALRRRTRGARLDRPLAWTRRVGGRSGVDVHLPEGCWSDDTQLRMATSRCIGSRGFDVEAFARVELPVWPSYALGGGRSSKAAAANLGKPDALWYANTYPGWLEAGGNGVAMRVQPHVWSAPDLDDGYQRDVIANAITTHGHPRALVGSLFHAGTLAHALKSQAVPDAGECVAIGEAIGPLVAIFDGDRYLATWMALWERAAGASFAKAWRATVGELLQAIDHAWSISRDTEGWYDIVVDRLALRSDDQRGNGILTSVAASALAYRARDVETASLIAANEIGTDTDTIGSMAAAVMGAVSGVRRPDLLPLDHEYLEREAMRLARIASGDKVESHSYPDLLRWAAPQTQADALVTELGGELLVEGLGPASALDQPVTWTAREDFGWQWVRVAFGQTLVVKRRPQLQQLRPGNDLLPPEPPPPSGRVEPNSRQIRPAAEPSWRPKDRGVSLDAAIKHARENLQDDRALGYTVRRVARDGTFADLVALVTALRDELRR